MAVARGGGPPHAATPPASMMTSVIAANRGPRRSGPVRSGRGPLAAWKCPARTRYPFPGGRGIRGATTISVYITVCTLSEFGLERQNSVFRRLVKVSAVVMGAGLVVTACSPVKVGSAAIVGNQRITIATLDTEVTNLSQAVARYKSTVQLSQAQQTQQTLTWLIRFKVNDELARQAGITVSNAQAEKALAEIYAAAKSSAQAQGISNVTLDLILAANGIPPNLANEVGRYQAIDDQFVRQANGGQRPPARRRSGHIGQAHQGALPGGQGPEDPGQPAVRPAELQPARDRRRARHGVPARRPGQGDVAVGADAGLLIVLATSPRVAPGLLSWPAWEALRSACRRAGPGRPSAAARAGRGRDRLPGGGGPPRVARADGTVVWLPEPGDDPPVPAGARLLRGSADLPGAHLLDLVATMDRLRVECPWDARQTHQSLAPHLLEEPYEALDALESGDEQAFCEELGDVLLQVVFHARVAAERADGYTIDDVADGIVAKLVRRHPHVFADVTVSGADEVYRNWDEIKREEKKERAERAGVPADADGPPSALDGVPFGQPALALAAQLQRRAARAGVPDEAGPPRRTIPGSDRVPAADIGRELFRLVVKAREAGRDPEMELRAAARRYRDLRARLGAVLIRRILFRLIRP